MAIPPSVMTSADILAAGGDPASRSLVKSHSIITGMGDSLMRGGYAGLPTIAKMANLSGGRYWYGNNYGVGGTRTDEILANQLAAALADKARWILVDGATNDLTQNFPAAGTADATALANLIAIWNALLANGQMPIDLGMFPNNAGNASKFATHELRRQIYCAKNGIPHINVWAKLANPDGTYKTGLNFDTIHPNSLATQIAAAEALLVLDNTSRLSQFGALIDSNVSTDLFANAVSFGGVAAALPTGYTAIGTGATYAVEASSDGSFGNFLSASYAGTATSAGFYGAQRTLAALGWSAGDKIAIGVRVKTSAAGIGTLIPRVSVNGSVPMTSQPGYYDDQIGAAGEDAFVYTEAQIGAGAVSTDTFRLQFTATTTGSTAQKMSIQRPVAINLTTNGL